MQIQRGIPIIGEQGATRARTRASRGCVSLAVLLGLSVLVTGCKKDEGKCTQGLEGALQSAEAGDDALTRQWRDYAYNHCDDAMSLQKLDQDIVAKQTALKKAALDKERKEKEQQQYVSLFQQWVASSRANPERASVTVVCDGEDDKALERSKERFCVRERALQGRMDKFVVRYWEKEPEAVLFSFVSPEPIRCENLGTATVVRQWPMPAAGGQTATRSLCQFGGGVLAGMQGLATEANGAKQYVFSKEYLEKDPGFAAKLK